MTLLGCAACATAALAGLEWEQPETTVEVHPLQASVTVAFQCINNGHEPVQITELIPKCGCISATRPEQSFAPGQTGALNVTFDFGRRKGEQWKGLIVKTSDPSEKPAELYIITHIPETYQPSVTALRWTTGDEPIPRTCRLLNHHKQAFKLLRAEAPGNKLKLELNPIQEGVEYELRVTPTSSAIQTSGVIPIKIYPEKPDGVATVTSYTVYAVIQ